MYIIDLGGIIVFYFRSSLLSFYYIMFYAIGVYITKFDTITIQTDTTTVVLNPVLSPEVEGGQIHLNIVTVL